MTLSANGKENFKLGEDEINKDAPQIKKIISFKKLVTEIFSVFCAFP
jgi:hypothetical protein